MLILKQWSLITVLAMCMALSTGVVHGEESMINQYDPNGNLVSGDGKYYEYNDANQLARVREKDSAGKVIAEYFYDFNGQRVKKVESGVATYYIGKQFETNVVAGKAENTSYFFADGERVAKKDSTGTYYFHNDHLGGVNAVTNTAGTVVAKTSYLPFGEVRQGGQEKYSYTGKEKDKATDLYYFDSRFNSPELRHFTQADSADADISDPQDLNRYAYVGNNPLSYVDPDGHKKKKKAKLSKREKWMIAHGVDPDHDKTSLKMAKKQEKAGKKYNVAAKTATSSVSTVQVGEITRPQVRSSNTYNLLGDNSNKYSFLNSASGQSDYSADSVHYSNNRLNNYADSLENFTNNKYFKLSKAFLDFGSSACLGLTVASVGTAAVPCSFVAGADAIVVGVSLLPKVLDIGSGNLSSDEALNTAGELGIDLATEILIK